MSARLPRPDADRVRVLVVHNRYRSELPSGEDKVVEQETALLAANGHDVMLFERRSDDIASMSLLDKARVPIEVPWNGRARVALRDSLRRTKPDIVHVHNTFPLLSPSVLAACADEGVPVVASLHNYYLICPVGTLMREGRPCTACVGGTPLPSLMHGCYRGSRVATLPLMVNMLINRRRWWSRTDGLFCASRAQRAVLVDGGVPAERLTVKHHFVADPGVTRTGQGEYVLYLGRLTEEKGIRVLMTAWDTYAGPRTQLVIAGDGPLGPEVREWAQRRTEVRVLGMQPTARCRELTLAAAAVVAPSVARESFGLVVAEAMAAGTPVVAAGHGGYAELVEPGVTGLLHQPGNAAELAGALDEVLRDPERNVRMGSAARSRYEVAFSPEAGLAALRAGYAAAIAAKSGYAAESDRSSG